MGVGIESHFHCQFFESDVSPYVHASFWLANRNPPIAVDDFWELLSELALIGREQNLPPSLFQHSSKPTLTIVHDSQTSTLIPIPACQIMMLLRIVSPPWSFWMATRIMTMIQSSIRPDHQSKNINPNTVGLLASQQNQTALFYAFSWHRS